MFKLEFKVLFAGVRSVDSDVHLLWVIYLFNQSLSFVVVIVFYKSRLLNGAIGEIVMNDEILISGDCFVFDYFTIHFVTLSIYAF